MGDIVERLRQHIGLDQLDEGDMVALVPRWEVEEAAAEIEQLRGELDALQTHFDIKAKMGDEKDAKIEQLREIIRDLGTCVDWYVVSNSMKQRVREALGEQ